KSRAALLRIRKPGLRRRLFCSDRATVTAIAANLALIAADNIAWHRIHMPAKRLQSSFQDLFARGHAILFTIHMQPFANRVQAPTVLRALKPPYARLCPLASNIVRRSKRSTIVHDRPAA